MRVSPASFFFRCAQNEQKKKKPRVFLFYFIGGRPTGLIRRKIQKYLPSLNSPPSRKDFFVFFIFFVKECPALYDVIRFGQKNKKATVGFFQCVHTRHEQPNYWNVWEEKTPEADCESFWGFFSCTYNKPRVCDISWSTPSSFFRFKPRVVATLYSALGSFVKKKVVNNTRPWFPFSLFFSFRFSYKITWAGESPGINCI
jgi:hypothetical protein